MRKTLLVATFGLVLGVCACRSAPQVVTSGCALDNGAVLAVSGREDGLYGVRAEAIDAAPLARLERTVLQAEGTDEASGKKWLRLLLDEADAQKLEAFSSEPQDRSIVVVVGGEVASRHKIREALRSREVQISCCDRRVCERLLAVFTPGQR